MKWNNKLENIKFNFKMKLINQEIKKCKEHH